MKTILATVYAVNPYKGSEDGTGWNFIIQIARFNKIIAITRENNEPFINQFMKENPSDLYRNITFLYFDLPYYLRFWKNKSRGAMLYFYIWQFSIPSFVKKQRIQYDIVHNINFHNDWTPSWLWRLKKPMVWGPIGHHHKIPKEYILKPYGINAFINDRLKWYLKKAFWNLDVFLKITKSNASKILCMNSSVQKVLRLNEDKIVHLSAIAAESPFPI
ncbi:MAG: hypothetical protein GYA62_15755, partial [Bacteroidales bacterium]|nr:hypothetical protein [Bacteroidales bacterium]